jgi:hypothetical protein
MVTSQELAQQNLNFSKALAAGQITQAQYDTAMIKQREQAATLSKPAYTPTPQATNINPTQNPTTPVIQDTTGTWAIKGSTVETLKDASGQITGYNITPPQQPEPTGPKSIGEQIADFNPAQWGADLAESIFGKKMNPQTKQNFVNELTGTMGSGIPGVKGTPTQFLGGMVSSVETPAYAVGGLLGIKNLPQPPTTTGAFLTSGWDSLTSGKLIESKELQELELKGPAYAAGSLGGDILLAYGYGKGIGYVTQTLLNVAFHF